MHDHQICEPLLHFHLAIYFVSKRLPSLLFNLLATSSISLNFLWCGQQLWPLLACTFLAFSFPVVFELYCSSLLFFLSSMCYFWAALYPVHRVALQSRLRRSDGFVQNSRAIYLYSEGAKPVAGTVKISPAQACLAPPSSCVPSLHRRRQPLTELRLEYSTESRTMPLQQ